MYILFLTMKLLKRWIPGCDVINVLQERALIRDPACMPGYFVGYRSFACISHIDPLITAVLCFNSGQSFLGGNKMFYILIGCNPLKRRRFYFGEF